MKKTKTNRKTPSFVRWIIWVFIVQFVLINISSALYAHKLTHFYEDKTVRPPASSQNIFVKTWRLFTGPRFIKSVNISAPAFPYDTIQLKTESGIFIDVWYAKPDSSSKGTVILFHGISSCKSQLLAEASDFRYQGYTIMLVDFRSHGNSGGHSTTVGYRETEEVKLAYDYVRAGGEKNIFLYGISMGATTIIKAISDYSLQVSGAILEMPFLSMQTYLEARARLLGFEGFPEKPFALLTTGWISIERGFNAYQFIATRYAKNVHCPVLMQWGTNDMVIRKKETNKIFTAIASLNKKGIVYEGAGHESLLQNDPVKWRAATEQFLKTNNQ